MQITDLSLSYHITYDQFNCELSVKFSYSEICGFKIEVRNAIMKLIRMRNFISGECNYGRYDQRG